MFIPTGIDSLINAPPKPCHTQLESPLESPFTTPSSSRRSSLGDDVTQHSIDAALATSRATKKPPLPSLDEEREANFQSTQPQLLSAPSSRAGSQVQSRRRSATIASPFSHSAPPSPMWQSCDTSPFLADTEEWEACSTVQRLEKIAAEQPPVRFYDSSNSSEESLARPHSPFFAPPAKDSQSRAFSVNLEDEARWEIFLQNHNEHDAPVFAAKDAKDATELDAHLRRAQMLAQRTSSFPLTSQSYDI